MSRLFLRCLLCERQQADGLLSGATWARIPVTTSVEHPAVKEGVTRVCPWCQNADAGWRARVDAVLGGSSAGGIEAVG